ncbi:adenylosuccinate lyase [bacterium]|nr:adenylosuccinate lyase [bacterium]
MKQKPQIDNILASRYASPEMGHIWSAEGKIILEREFWIALMKAQRELGLDIPAEAIAAYEKVKDQVDIESIAARERKTRHDVKARIEEFCDLAGYQHIHKGMTSRDLTDNIEQLQIFRGLELIRTKYAACIYRLAQRSAESEQVFLTGRTHNVAAQLTTWGKRLAMFGQDMLLAFQQFEHAAAHYPLRGIKGAVGTQLDQLTLFNGDAKKVDSLEEKIARFLGFNQELFAVGQVYPRSLDFEIISVFYQMGAGMSNFAKTLRIMAGDELATEGFKKGQVGSSAMPHKMNSRSSERLNGFHLVLNGFLNMVAGLAGDQWNEGDVSCSVVRRVALPNAFFTIDSMMETFLTILQEMGIYEAVIEKELERYFPFLASTTILMESVKRGAGREAAHEAIKEHAVAVALEMRSHARQDNDLLQRLADDGRIPLSLEQLQGILQNREAFIGNAADQVAVFVKNAEAIVSKIPAALKIIPAPML